MEFQKSAGVSAGTGAGKDGGAGQGAGAGAAKRFCLVFPKPDLPAPVPALRPARPFLPALVPAPPPALFLNSHVGVLYQVWVHRGRSDTAANANANSDATQNKPLANFSHQISNRKLQIMRCEGMR